MSDVLHRDPEWLREQYVVNRLSMAKVAALCGVTEPAVRRWLLRHSIPIRSRSEATALAVQGSKNPNWRGGEDAMRALRQGIESIARSRGITRCSSCALLGARNPFFGRKHTAETRARMRTAQQRRDPATRFRVTCAPERVSEVQRRLWAALSPEQRTARMHSFLEAGLATNKRSSRTEPECIVAGLLDALGVAYERTVRVRQFTVDLLVGSTVIECYGDYWHCNPTLYGASYYNASLHMTACAKWAKDLARQRAIEALGYRVLVFWEQDIRSVPAAVKRALRAEFVSA